MYPVTFQYDNQTSQGTISRIKGAAADAQMYHLMVNDFFWGQLIYSDDQGRWFFHAQNKRELEELADYFANCIKQKEHKAN